MPRVVFVHAHPDDEAIFTGGTIALLSDAGVDVDLVVATGGELGLSVAGETGPLAGHREAETLMSCDRLGMDPHDVRFLPYQDSGMRGENPHGLCHQDPVEAARRMLRAVPGEIDAIVGYDDGGIYGHPDHVAVHHIAIAAARLHEHEYGTRPILYEATVDREYLHFVETHVVVEAGLGQRPAGRGLASTSLGLSTLEIDTAIDVHPVLDRKRQAMAAHASQLPADAPLFELGQANFAAVYGWEWYRRTGPPGILEGL